MEKINIWDFPDYERNPDEGKTKHSDSKVFDLLFEKEGTEYEIRTLISIEYDRYVSNGDSHHPGEDYNEVTWFEIETVKGVRYHNDDEIELGEKELRRITKYITETIEFI